jgi:hypothetical protein
MERKLMAKKAMNGKASPKNGKASPKAKRIVRRAWTKDDNRELKKHSKGKTAVVAIVKAMKRSAGALRQQARKLGVPLGHRR